MMGTVGSTIVVKGKKIRLKEDFDSDQSFKIALDKRSENSRQLRTAAVIETKSKRQSFRNNKATKDR
jgi:hypothetical protein